MGCSIKNETFIERQNRELELTNYPVNREDPSTWKYYLNLQGQYHVSDLVPHPTDSSFPRGPIYIKSLDDPDAYIPFTHQTLSTNSLTLLGYQHNTQNYRNLIRQYPNHTDLIKNILFPLLETDLDFAINAEHLTLLRFPGKYTEIVEEMYLERTELFHIVQQIEVFLTYMRERWYKGWMTTFEDGYDPAFWGNIWQHLTLFISVVRIENIHTAFANSFHIWEYLKSVGIGDYRDVLTDRQALFLYRNMRQILRDRGRQSNLYLLVDELLKEENLNMVNKVIRQETDTYKDRAEWSPEFVPEPVETRNFQELERTEPQPTSVVIQQLFASGDEIDNDFSYVEKIRKELAATTFNYEGTKLLEIQTFDIDDRYRVLFSNTFFDTVVYFIENNLLKDTISYQDLSSGVTLFLTPKEFLILLTYLAHKSVGQDPQNIPNEYTFYQGAFVHNIQPENLPFSFTYYGETFPITTYLDFEPVDDPVNYLSEDNLLKAREDYLKSILDVFRPTGGLSRTPISNFIIRTQTQTQDDNFNYAFGKIV